MIQPVGDEWVVYDDATKEAHCLRPLAAKVFEYADGHTKVEALAVRISEDLGHTVDPIDVQDAIAQLEGRNLMLHGNGISRRDALRRGAQVGAVAVATPLIASVFASPAFAGASKTCGNLLCCTCFTGSSLNANNCCYIPHVTQNCECTNASGNSCKFCKPSGVGAPSDADCAAQWGCTPGVNCNPSINDGEPLTLAVCTSAAGGPPSNPNAGGACCGCGCACGDCTNPLPCCNESNPSGTPCGPVAPNCQ